MKLRKLNEQGLRRFREFLEEARAGDSQVKNAPVILLTLPMTSEEIGGAPELEQFSHITRYELACYLNTQFANIDPVVIEGPEGLGDPGFWAAVALFYFDLLVPGYRAGQEKPLADICYIPGTSASIQLGRYFRHRLAGPYRLYQRYGEFSEPLLLSPPGKQSLLYSKITDTVFYTETPCVVEAVKLLYFNERSRKLKGDLNAKDKPGSLPRLLAVVDQLDLTYDLLGINGEALLAQLPEEFNEPWSAKTTNSHQ